MPAEKNYGPSSESDTINNLKSDVSALAMIIQDNIPNANLTPVLSNLNVKVPGIASSHRNNSLSVNQKSSSRSQNDNARAFEMHKLTMLLYMFDDDRVHVMRSFRVTSYGSGIFIND
ncbi:hypothetical protein R6Q57_005557 [Mikania cordata]